MNKKKIIKKLYDKDLKKKDIIDLVESNPKYVTRVLKEYKSELDLNIIIIIWRAIKKNFSWLMASIAIVEFVILFCPQIPHDILEFLGFEQKEIAVISILMTPNKEDEIINVLKSKICRKFLLTIEVPKNNTVTIENFRFFFVTPDWPKSSIILAEKVTSRGSFTATMSKLGAVHDTTQPAKVITNSDPFNKGNIINIIKKANCLAYLSLFPGIRVRADRLYKGDYLKFFVYVIPGVNNYDPPFNISNKVTSRYGSGYSYEYDEDTYKKYEEVGNLDVGKDKITVKGDEWHEEVTVNW